ncbi:hypothetical protein OH687_25800 [Burkholderia anthina]|nr:hypothetical protein OH687_25800 [Burkholderia anthina]
MRRASETTQVRAGGRIGGAAARLPQAARNGIAVATRFGNPTTTSHPSTHCKRRAIN